MTTKCTQTDEAFAWKPTWTCTAGEADQKATLTFSPTCTTAASLAPHLRMQEWNYSRAAIWKMLPSTAAPPLPSSCFAHCQCPFALAAEASAEKSISTFLDNPASASRSLQAEGKGHILFSGGSVQASWAVTTTAVESQLLRCQKWNFFLEEEKRYDKLNILLMFSVIFSHIQRRNIGELNQLS